MPAGAIFHFDVGKNIHIGYAQAASDYRERSGDYADRGGYGVGGIVGWDGDADSLWAAAEKADTPKRRTVEVSSRPRVVARQMTIALPAVLTDLEREKLVKGFALYLKDKHKVALQWDIHKPDPNGDQRNHHAHLMMTARKVEGNVFGEKTRTLDKSPTGGEFVKEWREEWATRTNRVLTKAGHTVQISHLSRADEQAQNPDKDIPAPNAVVPRVPFQRGRKNKTLNEERKRSHRGNRKHRKGLQEWQEVRDTLKEIKALESELKAVREREASTPPPAPTRPETTPITTRPTPPPSGIIPDAPQRPTERPTARPAPSTPATPHRPTIKPPAANVAPPMAPTTRPPPAAHQIQSPQPKPLHRYSGAILTVEKAYREGDATTAARELLNVTRVPSQLGLAGKQKRADDLKEAITATPDTNPGQWPKLIEWVTNHPRTRELADKLRNGLTPLFQKFAGQFKSIPETTNRKGPPTPTHRPQRQHPER